MRRVVLYHANCYDGFGAAWAAWKKLGDAAKYLPVKYGDPLPDAAWDCDLYIVDFSYPRAVLEGRALDQSHCLGATMLRVLDHHKTAEADLAGLPFCTFDMNKSGARLAWEYFNSEKPVPRLIEYIEDRDLWRFMVPGCREVSVWLRSWAMDFRLWDTFAERLSTLQGCEPIWDEGMAILRFQSQQVAIMADHARWQDVGGHRVPVANATVFFSEVGEELCRRHPEAPFAAYYLDRADGKRQWGLRGRSGGIDVSAVAKRYGGGGHPAAAGFVESHP